MATVNQTATVDIKVNIDGDSTVQDLIKQMQVATMATKELDDGYKLLQKTLKLLTPNTKAYNDTEKQAIAIKTELVKRTAEYNVALNKEVLTYTNAGKSIKDANAQIQQGMFGIQQQAQYLITELPNLAQSPMLFMRSIGNNFAQIGMEMQRTGAGITSVFANIARGLIGPVGIVSLVVTLTTVLTANWGAIKDWISGLFSAKNELDAVAQAQENVNKVVTEATIAAAKNIAQLDLLYKSATDVNNSLEDRLAATDRLQKMYPDYLGNLSDEAIIAGRAADAYERLRKQLLEKAVAEAIAKKYGDNAVKIMQLQDDIAKKEEKIRQRFLGGGLADFAKAFGNASNAVERGTKKMREELELLGAEQLNLEGNFSANDFLEDFGSSGGVGGATGRAGSAFKDMEPTILKNLKAFYKSIADNSEIKSLREQLLEQLGPFSGTSLTFENPEEDLSELFKQLKTIEKYEADSWNRRLKLASQFANSLAGLTKMNYQNKLQEIQADGKVTKEEEKELKKRFELNKAAMAAQAAIDGAAAVVSALKNPPGPPFTVPFAVAAGAMSAIEIATILSTKMGNVTGRGTSASGTGSFAPTVNIDNSGIAQNGFEQEIINRIQPQRYPTQVVVVEDITNAVNQQRVKVSESVF